MTEATLRALPQIRLPECPKGLSFELPRVTAPRFEVKAAAAGGVISFFGVIGLDVTAASMAAALRQIGDRPVRLQINSPGGDYFEGAAIYNQLRLHKAGVTVDVLGMAASAASLVAMGARRIEIARNAQMMIHRAWLVSGGNAETMARAAEFLERVDEAMTDVYAARTGQDPGKVAAMMAVETFMASSVAVDLGFADAVLAIDGPPRALSTRDPQNGRDLEAALQRVGFSRSVASRVAAAAWPAISAAPRSDLTQLAARVQRATLDLRKG